MKVILLKDVAKVGKKYEVKEVANGFATNSLIPRGLAVTANDSALRRIEDMKKNDTVRKEVREDLLLKNIKDLEGVVVEISGKASEKGHLFAGIHKEELIPAVKEQSGLDIDAEHIVLTEPLKEVGEHNVAAKVGDVETHFTVKISEEK